MDRKTIWAWCLYDFGNSAFAVLFPAIYGSYYQGHVVGGDAGTLWWSRVGSLSMLMVALSSPLLGGIADHAGVRKRMLAIYTTLAVCCVLGFTAVAPGMVVTGFVLATLANFAFEGGIVFYNSYLPDIAPPSHHGRVSARGFAVGYVGSLLALGLAAVLLGPLGLHAVWIALAVQWALFALPAFRYLPPDRRTALTVPQAALQGVRGTLKTLRSVLGMKDLRRFLLAYFFYMDGVNTVIFFAGVYASQELKFSQTALIAMLGVVQVSALLGSLAMAKPSDVLGPRWAVRVTLVWWVLVVTAAFFATTALLFWVVATLAGLGLGAIQASSRAFMSRLIPDGREGELFGFYALCGKTGAILGPFLFGTITAAVGSQRPAVLSVAAFYLVGLVLLQRVRNV